jgi:predicted dienelactone hydrolase
MKALRIGMIALALLFAAVAAYVLSTAMYTTRPVGFQLVRVPDPGGAPIVIALWYPTDARPWPTTPLGLNLMSVARDAPVAGRALPLVVISHGNGGGPASHADLALALAQQGFVVAAPMHTGDNYADQREAGSAKWLVDRSRHVRATLDFVLQQWPSHDAVDAQRVGLFGFSAGGFTTLATIGGQPDLRLIASHCAAAPEFACRLLAGGHSPLLDPAQVPPASAFVRDARVRAAVVAAPGLGFTFVPDGLAGVSVPVQVWSGDADGNVPTATNAAPVGAALGAHAEMHRVPGAAHFSFLVPCGLFGPPMLCRDDGGFDRKRFHADMDAAVVAFLQKQL